MVSVLPSAGHVETLELEVKPIIEKYLREAYPDVIWKLSGFYDSGGELHARFTRDVAPPVHFGSTCAASGMSPIRGARYAKKNEPGVNLCEDELLKLDEVQQKDFVRISRPGDMAVHESSSPELASVAPPILSTLPAPVAELVSVALSSAGGNAAMLEKALSQSPPEQLEGMAFLVACMPQRDLICLQAEFLLESVGLAYDAKSTMPWGSDIPMNLFFEFVLPYVQANETREPWRDMLFSLFGPQVQQVDTVEAAVLLLNKEVFAQLGVSYHATKRPKPDQSPNESVAASYASCTGLGILLADACRAVCIPARLAGVPLWSDRDMTQSGGPHTWVGSGNHTWVEIWDPTTRAWRFIGASEQGPLDQTWFAGKAAKVDGSHAMTRIYGLSFKPTGVLFPCVWLRDNDYVYGEDVTARYTNDCAPQQLDAPWWETLVRPEPVALHAQARQPDDSGKHGLLPEASPGQDVASHSTEPLARSWDELLGCKETVPSDQTAAMRMALWRKCKDDIVGNMQRLAEVYDRSAICTDEGCAMRFTFDIIGSKPETGYPLFICLHGGGGCPQEVNDEQWRQMQAYYKQSICCGICVAPRACQNTWNCHWVGESFALYDRLIQNMIAFMDVDSNRVYLLGYSAGGDGVYQIAPRMADRWAGANMSAGHPNGVSIHNLYHVPFLIQVGERDAAFNRNKVSVEYGKKLLNRASKYPGGYISECWVHKEAQHSHCKDRDPFDKCYPVVSCHGRGDGVEMCNTSAVAWLVRHTRNPTPSHVMWDVATCATRTRPAGAIAAGLSDLSKCFYWLDISGGLPTYDAACVEVRCDSSSNSVHVMSCGSWLRLLFDSRLLDLSKPVQIEIANLRCIVHMRPCLATMARTLLERGDPELMFEAEVILEWDGTNWRVSSPGGEVRYQDGSEAAPISRVLTP